MKTPVVEIRAHERTTMPDHELVALTRFENVLVAEADPEEPPIPAELTIIRSRLRPAYRRQWTWLAWEADDVVGEAEATIEDTGDNEHLLWIDLEVHPGWRRRGLGRSLLERLVAVAEQEGRALIMGWTDTRRPAGEAFAGAVGADLGQRERESALHLDAVDWQMVESWVEAGPRRAPGYEVFGTADGYPEEMLEEFSRLYEATNTAPRDDLQIEDEHVTPELLREWQRTEMADGRRIRSWWARHSDTGRLVGWTDVRWHPLRPHRVDQEWTAVDPAHRGHALGKWLKARALLAIRDEWPAARKVVTQNAYSNDAMLGINNALGFRETHGYGCWQARTSELRDWLDRRPGAPE